MRRAGGEGLSPVQLALAVAVAAVLAILVGLWLAGLGGALRGLLPGRGDEAAGPPGDVTITSDPAGAQVLVDGKVRGHMPLTLSQPGERRLLSGAGYGWLDEHWRGVKIEDRLRARLRHACARAIDRCLADQSYEALS